MIKPPKPANESERLQALLDAGILDTAPEEAFDKITKMIAQICGTEFCVISLVDKDRQWFKSKVGLAASETPREVSFCGHAILGTDVMEVSNATFDPRFSGNPLVTGDPEIRFYAGAPLLNSDGLALGTLCVFDRKVKVMEEFQREALVTFAKRVTAMIEERKKTSN